MVDAGTENVPVGADIGTIVHSEEDMEFYLKTQRATGYRNSVAKLVEGLNVVHVQCGPAIRFALPLFLHFDQLVVQVQEVPVGPISNTELLTFDH